jgi:hypothetical protein
MRHSRTPTQDTAADGFPADPIDGYVCGLSPSFSHALVVRAQRVGQLAPGDPALALVLLPVVLFLGIATHIA